MKLWSLRSLLVTALAMPALLAAPTGPPAPPDRERLVQDLADDSYRVREDATRQLWKMADAALPLLQQAATGEDPEAARRARELIRKIDLGILPDSSPEIVQLVLSYDESSPAARRNVIERLKAHRAWRQILKLRAMEKDEQTLAITQDAIEGVAIEAARDCLSQQPPDVTGAMTYLKIVPPGPAEWIALAALHRSEGTLDAALAATPADPAHAMERYALLTVAGRSDQAIEAASANGMTEAAARLKLLAGDPLPWLENGLKENNEPSNAALGMYRQHAIKVWKSSAFPTESSQSFRRLVETRNDNVRSRAVALLFLVGDTEFAEKQLMERQPAEAFAYFRVSERVDDAFKALGLDPAKPDFKGWAEERFKVLVETPEEEVEQSLELASMGRFLDEHGMQAEIDAAFVPGLKKLAKGDSDVFTDFISRFFDEKPEDSRMVRPAFDAIAEFAGEDGDLRWQQTLEAIFSHRTWSGDLWNWLKDIEPEVGRRARLEHIGLLLGCLPDRDKEVPGLLAKVWGAYQKLPPEQRQKRWVVMAQIALRSQNPEDYLKVLQAAGDIEGFGPNVAPVEAFYLGALGRWRESADLWLKQIGTAPANPLNRARAAAALRRAGDEKAAEEQERMAERLALGECSTQLECGDAFVLAGDSSRALTWWRRAATDCAPDSSYFHEVTARLMERAFDEHDWPTASAFAEAHALLFAAAGGDAELAPRMAQVRMKADLSRALARLKDQREDSLGILDRIHRLAPLDGALADDFYPSLRAAGLTTEHDRWFEESWKSFNELIARYPNGDNLLNTAAWTAARASRRLDEAEANARKALERRPAQAAYLDTMGEIFFARHNREEAVKWSTEANLSDPLTRELLQQLERFQSGAFPSP